MRSTWDEYFMNMAHIAKTRSTCSRRNVGAIIVRERHIISSGYNGAPTGVSHCIDKDHCLRSKLNIPSGERHEICRATHAEQNALIQCAYHGVSTKGATIYITVQPCAICAKLIINAGIVRIVYQGDYPDELAMSMITEAGIEIEKL